MTNYVQMLTNNSFILGDDGIYKATILATTHGLGSAVTVRTAEHRNENCEYENVLLSYMVDVYGRGLCCTGLRR